jgi:hypothetical protein
MWEIAPKIREKTKGRQEKIETLKTSPCKKKIVEFHIK